MAKIKQGILGGISGTIGNVVGSRWRGIDYIRTKPASFNSPDTEAQLAQRKRFALISGILKRSGPIIRTGFRNTSGSQTSTNRAMSLNLRNAVTGSYPDISILAEQLMFSEGSLQSSDSINLDTTQPGVAGFAWNGTVSLGGASSSDTVIAVLYNTVSGEIQYQLNGILRSDEQAELSIPAAWAGDTLCGYLIFVSVEHSGVSETRCTGIKEAAE